MKKYLSILFLIAFIIPSIAFASWWNPFSWFYGWTFNKQELAPQTQAEVQKTPEEKISELQKQLDDLKTPKPAEVKIPEKKTIALKVSDTQKKSTQETGTPVVSPVVNIPTLIVVDVCKNIEGTQTLVPAGMFLDSGNCIVVSTITPPQSKTATDGAIKQSVNYDQQLSQLIAKNKQNISVFQSAVKETQNFVPIVQATMNKYPNEITIQQSGQDLLNENTNLASISNKLVSIETNQANKLSSYLGLGTLPTTADVSQYTQQYNDYYGQYQTSNTKIASLINTFTSNQKIVLDRLLQEKQQILEETKQKNDDLENASQAKQEKLNAINQQIADLNAKYATDVATARNRGGSMAQINLHIQVLTDQYNVDYATLMAQFQQIKYGS